MGEKQYASSGRPPANNTTSENMQHAASEVKPFTLRYLEMGRVRKEQSAGVRGRGNVK